MFELVIDTQNILARKKKLEQGLADFPGNVELFSVEAGKIYRTNLREEAPHSHTARPDPDPRKTMAHAAEGLDTHVTGGGLNYTIHATSEEKYMLFQAFGSGPHPIVARGDYDLAFFWENKGVWFKGPIVSHPGFPANLYWRRAYTRSIPEFEKELQLLAKKLGATN